MANIKARGTANFRNAFPKPAKANMAKNIPTADLPDNAVKLFALYAADAGNWSGSPLVNGNVTLLGEKEDRGLLSYLKRAGLVTTREDHEPGQPKCYWLSFTDAGRAFAAERGIEISE